MPRTASAIAILVGTLALGCDGCKGDSGSNGVKPTGSADATALAPSGSAPVTVIPVPSASVLKTLNPGDLPVYDGATGIVEGTLLVSGDPAPPAMGRSFEKCPAAKDVYAKQFREGTPRPDGNRPLADAIVAIEMATSGLFVPERREAELLTVSDCTPSARTVVLTYGQRLEVKNASPDATKRTFAPQFENWPEHALMLATPGADPVRLYPKALGRYRLVDRAGQDWFEADVFVIGHPLHAVTDLAGHFRIEGVPVGKRKVDVRHPAIDAHVVKEIDVKQNVVEKVDLVLPNTRPAVAPPRDAGPSVLLP